MLVGAMSERSPHLSAVISIAVLAILSACAADQQPAVGHLDELTAVTIAHSRTPIIMSTDTISEWREYVQIGAIEVNRMGTLQYYLWLGISEVKYTECGWPAYQLALPYWRTSFGRRASRRAALEKINAHSNHDDTDNSTNSLLWAEAYVVAQADHVSCERCQQYERAERDDCDRGSIVVHRSPPESRNAKRILSLLHH